MEHWHYRPKARELRDENALLVAADVGPQDAARIIALQTVSQTGPAAALKRLVDAMETNWSDSELEAYPDAFEALQASRVALADPEALDFHGCYRAWNDVASLAEGWGIFLSDTRGAEIQRDDEAGIFEDDDAALEHVRELASRGSLNHRLALRIHELSRAALGEDSEA